MQKSPATFILARSRLALRAPVGLWKQWREPKLCRQLAHQLAVCAIFKDEAIFLEEWLTFHAGVGVTHFYLYNNQSTDDFRNVLQPWIAAGYVTLIDWPGTARQISAYADCVCRFKWHARWIAFIDLDEFLFATTGRDLLPVLAQFDGRPGIEVWQLFFGASGHLRRPAGPVTEAYTMCAPGRNASVKTIANPRLVYKAHIHQFKYWKGVGLDPAGQLPGLGVNPVFAPLRINHYWSRSIEDLELKIRRGRVANGTERPRDSHLEFEKGLNAQADFTIQPVARGIRRPFAS